MANINIGSFFGNDSSSSGGLGSLLSDYSAIKNGSYRKLLKANYDAQKAVKSTSSGKAKTGDVLDEILNSKKNPQISAEEQKANSALTDGVSKLSASIKELQKDGTFEDTENGSSASEKTASALKSFVDNYNNVIRNAKESTLSNVTSNVSSMMKATDSNAKALKEIGINVQDDGTLILDEKKAASADPKKVHEIFDQDEVMSYGSTIGSRMRFASYGAGVSNGTSSDNVATKSATNTAAGSMKQAAKDLSSGKLYEKDEAGQYNVAGITAKAKEFVNSFNSMYNAAKLSTNSGVSSNLTYMVNRINDNAGELSEYGITKSGNNTLNFHEDKFREADMNRVRDFFRDFASGMATNASLVEHYMSTQAEASNGYTSDGSYNVSNNSGAYSDTM
ncbi:MAG: hypothetical protein K6F53_10360 [Lachnospiraceae bacterium]|nr:hypothetical protein [Lachnospiraceae bacterium]